MAFSGKLLDDLYELLEDYKTQLQDEQIDIREKIKSSKEEYEGSYVNGLSNGKVQVLTDAVQKLESMLK